MHIANANVPYYPLGGFSSVSDPIVLALIPIVLSASLFPLYFLLLFLPSSYLSLLFPCLEIHLSTPSLFPSPHNGRLLNTKRLLKSALRDSAPAGPAPPLLARVLCAAALPVKTSSQNYAEAREEAQKLRQDEQRL